MKNTSLLSRFTLGAALACAAFFTTGCPTVPPADPLEAAPQVQSFSASESLVPVGTTVKLSWSVENATEVKIEEVALGAISGVSELTGQVDVAITRDSLFVLTARNARGAADKAVVSVRVGSGEGALLLTALPRSVAAGEPVTIAWSAPGAGSVTLSANPGGSIDLAGQGGVGSVVVNPTANTVYTLTAGVRSATVDVSVLPALLSFEGTIDVLQTSDAGSTDAGSSDAGATDAGVSDGGVVVAGTVTLTWTTANATRVTITSPGRPVLLDERDPARVASGSFVDSIPAPIDPGQLFPYLLTVYGPGLTLTKTVVMSVPGNPAVLTFTGPKYASPLSDGGVTLSWTTREADGVTLAADGVPVYRAPSGSVAAGSVSLPKPANDTTYVLTATNSRGGSVSKSLLVDIVGAPTVMLTATPSTVAPGDPIAVSWTGTEIRNVRISLVGGSALYHSDATVADTGSLPNPISFFADQVVRIDVDNGAGQSASATAPITVTGALQFSIPAGSTRAGEAANVSWTTGATITGLPHDDIVVRTGSTGFEDITSTGATVTITGDGATRFAPVGFSAPFFGKQVGSEVWIDADGYMSFSEIGVSNYSSVAIPSSKMEAYSIAPCWTDSTATGHWLVKDVPTGGNVLIVQWDAKFQVKVFSTGQVDVEYKTAPSSCGGRGVRGPYGDTGFAFTNTLAANLGLTLFGPKTSPTPVRVNQEFPLVGTVTSNGVVSTVRGDLGPVVRANEFYVSEAMVNPSPSVGAAGQWFELFNARSTPIDLTGWTIGATDGGVASPLSGVIPAHGVLVVGASNDPALNDDAGVSIALTGAPLGLDAGVLAIARNGTLSTLTWPALPTGVSVNLDIGPYRFSTDTSSSVARAQTCAPTTGYGSFGQLGTPGTKQDCGFPYVLTQIRPGYFDISSTGSKAVFAEATKDDDNFTLQLTGAPFTFFGTPFTSTVISTNGFIAFDTVPVQAGPSINHFPDAFPSTSDVNGAVVLFGGDLIGRYADSEVYYQRVGANVDPAAAAPHWIVQWHHWSHFSSSAGDVLNFQVKLFDDGVIEYHFGKMTSFGSSSRYGAGISSVTWLENPAGTQALVVNTRSYTPGISPDSSFRFSPR